MKSKFFALAAACLLSPALAAAQGGRLVLPDFRGLDHKAVDSVNISLDGWLLRSVAALMDDSEADGAAAKKLLSGIKSVQIRNFQFDADFAYSAGDIDAVRRQLQAPGWAQMMQVHNRGSREDVDVYMLIENNRTLGLALIASEPRQFTIVNIVGSVSMEDLPALQRQFHLPLQAPLALL